MRSMLCAFVVLVLVSLATAQTKPTTEPAVSTPKATLVALARAMEKGDVVALRTLIAAENDNEKKLLEGMLALAAAQREARDAAIAKFGKDTAELTSAPKSAETIAAIEIGEESFSGSEATIRVPGGDLPMIVKKIDGQWKVPMSYVARGSIAESERRLVDVKRMTEIFREGAADITAGKYRNAVNAADALRMKLRTAATQPATAPATKP